VGKEMRLVEFREDLMSCDDPVAKDFATKIYSNGGWRSLFDPFSSEWHDSDLDYKVLVLKSIAQYMPIQNIALLFKDSYNHRPDIAEAADFALAKILNYVLTGKK
jgi:hypothetical protein